MRTRETISTSPEPPPARCPGGGGPDHLDGHEFVPDREVGPLEKPCSTETCRACGKKVRVLSGAAWKDWSGRMEAAGYTWDQSRYEFIRPVSP